jgi:hypothetical protein
MIVYLTVLLAVSAYNAMASGFELPAAKVTIRVVDENRQPVENAKVSLGFGDTSTNGFTDANGLFTGEGRCNISGMGSMITKDGYYFGPATIPKFHEHDNTLNRWLPWNETYTAILRPIEKPVALYAKRVETEIPVLNQPCGYDLEVGDWTAPNGKGIQKDLIFTIHQEYRGIQDYDVLGELTFENPLNGLQAVEMSVIGTNSIFKWERQAPEDGYQTKFQLQNSWHKDTGAIHSFKFGNGIWEGYFFRVRTVEQDDKIVSANYGKIRGGIEVFPNKQNPKIDFTYYFNPTPNDRNLEWDTHHDLFPGLKDMENPRMP